MDLPHTIEPRLPAGLRTEQNWVGGPGWSPLRADFVPPPESEVPALVTDVASFLTATHGNPVVRAAIAHAQLETIHPFIDGNGRTGRALIHTVLRRCDALRYTVSPISTVFTARTDVYPPGLTSYRDPELHTDEWVIGFAQAAEQAAQTGVRPARDAAALDDQLLQRLVEHRRRQGTSPALPRRDAVATKILANLSTHPVLTTESAAARYGVSAVTAHRALTERANRVGAGDTDHRRPDQGPSTPAVDRFGRLRTDSPE